MSNLTLEQLLDLAETNNACPVAIRAGLGISETQMFRVEAEPEFLRKKRDVRGMIFGETDAMQPVTDQTESGYDFVTRYAEQNVGTDETADVLVVWSTGSDRVYARFI